MPNTSCIVSGSACANSPWADVREQGPRDSTPSGLLAGAARTDISPPVGIAQMNWGSQTHVRAVGVDPIGMKATALVLSDGHENFAMVDVDRLLVDGLEPAIAEASRATGIPEAHIRLAASHTHSGAVVDSTKGPPGKDLSALLEMDERYRCFLVDKIVGLVVQANSRLRAAHIHGGRGEGTININRRVRAQGEHPPAVGRRPDGFVDREFVVFRIDDAEGQPLAIVTNFQCHPTVLGYPNKFISPDWVGATRATIEQAFPGALSLFFQGAAGNLGPIEGFTGDLSVAHRLGRTLGHQIAAAAWQVETVRREPTFEGFNESTAYQAKQYWRVQGPRDATLKFASRIVRVPRRTHSEKEREDVRARLARAKAQLSALAPDADPGQLHQAAARVRRFADLLAAWNRPVSPSLREIEIQALRIGELAVFAMPGEPFAEIGAAVKRNSPFTLTMFCGYSNGVGADYLLTDEEFAYGGYEVDRTPNNPGAADIVIEAASELLEGLHQPGHVR